MGKFDDIRWKWLEERGIEVYGDPYQLDYMLSLWKDPEIVKSVFCEAKAGTGKTALAVLAGAYELENGNYKKIRYVRNAVPVRNQGFVKGDPMEKDAPYMQPFKDALDLVKPATFEVWVEKGIAEAHTSSFTRGSTWENEFIIIDEVQNFDMHELRTVLTRVGKGSKIVVVGSKRQVDNKSIRKVRGLLPFEVYMEHFKGDARISFHELHNCYRDWFADLADDIDFTIKILEEEGNERS
jgi:predicted ribonuclease YlaK